MRENCPNCNSLQPFNRQSETKDGTTKVFIRCSMCHWRAEIFQGTEEEHKIRSRINKLRGGVVRGAPAGRQLDAQTKKLVKEISNGS